jgi:hypothetical protein
MIWGRRQHSHVSAPVTFGRVKRIKLAPPRRTTQRLSVRALPARKLPTVNLQRTVH